MIDTLAPPPPVWLGLSSLFFIYVLAVTLFLITDNRAPASTLAWLFIMYLAPVLGVLVYLFFGRSAEAFQQPVGEVRRVMGVRLQRALLGMPPLSEEMGATSIQPIPSEAALGRLSIFLNRTRSAVLTIHNELEILQDASTQYPRMMEDMRQAKHSIHIQYFIWQVDEYTEEVKQLLMAKAQEGVEVRLLYDAVGSVTMEWLHPGYRRALREAGVQMYPYLNYYSPFHLHTINYRNHRKIVVIDGRICHTGGLNMGREHLVGAGPYQSWRDTNVRIMGEAVAAHQALFLLAWYNTTKEVLEGSSYFPPAHVQSTYLPLHLVVSGPDSAWNTIRQQYFAMILSARHHVYIQSPFFIPDSSIIEALRVAALSGVDVRLMVSPRDTVNPLPNWAGNTYLAEVARAGVRVFFYEKGYMHAKTICVDSSVCSIGTANMDLRSFSVNYENNVVIYDEILTRSLEADFAHDLEGCREFSFIEYSRLPYPLRLRDSIARLFSPLL